jgi:hypothetical protein
MLGRCEVDAGSYNAAMGRPRTSSVTKVLFGTQRRDRARDDEIPVGAPTWDDALLGPATADETAAFAALLPRLPASHVGAKDGHLVAQAARLYARLRFSDGKLAERGLLTCGVEGLPVPSPYFRISKQTRAELMVLLIQLGLTPAGRLKIAQPLAAKPTSANEWAALDD